MSVPSQYQAYIDKLISDTINDISLNSGGPYRGQNNHMVFNFTRPCSWCCQNPDNNTSWSQKKIAPANPITINITTASGGSCSWSASLSLAGTIQRVRNSDNYVLETYNNGVFYINYAPDIWIADSGSSFYFPTTHNFNSLTECFEFLTKYFRCVNVYVDGDLWGRAFTPDYTWQSVPSISGKNGILSLPVLVSTDGEPVSSGSASDFSTLPSGAIVRTLANEAVSGG